VLFIFHPPDAREEKAAASPVCKVESSKHKTPNKMLNETELIGNEIGYLKPVKHSLKTFIVDMLVLAGIALIVASVLWWTWNR
jgi:hypothetical protein